MKLQVRRVLSYLDERRIVMGEEGRTPQRKVAVVAIVENPYAGQGLVRDLDALVAASEELGGEITALAAAAMKPFDVQSYGKAGVVGLLGDQEHCAALLTTVYGNVMRSAAGGGKAWISSNTKRAAPGATIDVPLAHKDALYVRSHYDTMTLTLHDAPMPDEIAIICCYANRGRIHARVGGLAAEQIEGHDGLV
jgi:hypothetical protein